MKDQQNLFKIWGSHAFISHMVQMKEYQQQQ